MAPYLSAPRGPSSLDVLRIQWEFPIWQPEAVSAEAGADAGSRAVAARRVLAEDEAYRALAKKDPRPLLVMRECLTCTGTDDALLTRQADNEKTMLLARWFHCVKLPPNVIEADHPFHGLFDDKDPAHLFVATHDGKLRKELKGDQSRTELWKVMGGLLEARYEGSTKKPLKGIFRLLDEMDDLDRDIAVLERKLDEALEARGPGNSKVKKITKDLDEQREELAELAQRARELAVLELKAEEKERRG